MEINQYKKSCSQKLFYESHNYEDTFLKANFAGITYPTRNYRAQDPCLQFNVFEYVKMGNIHIKTNGKEYVARQGEVYVLKRGLNVEYYSGEKTQIEKIWFNMRGRLIDSLFEAYNLSDDVIISRCDIENEIFKIHTALQSSDSTSAVTCKLAFYIHEIIMKISLSNNTLDLSFNPGSKEKKKLKEYLDARIYYKTSLELVANRMRTTEKYVIRVFKAKYGITPYAYLLYKRMEKAKELFCLTELSVKEIAAKLAFSDGNYFSRAFKKYTGVSPIEYRQISKENKTAEARRLFDDNQEK